jgi:hypothetical protein
MREYIDGIYYALLEGRLLFDFVHEDKLAPEELAKYSAPLLPNTAQRRAVPAVAGLRRRRRLAIGDVRDRHVHGTQPAAA